MDEPMKSIINLTGEELPAGLLDEYDVMEIIELAFTLRFDRAAEPGFAAVLEALFSDFPNAANAVVVLPANSDQEFPAAVEAIRGLLPETAVIVFEQ